MARCEKCGEEYLEGTEHVCSPQPEEPAEEPEAEEKPEEGTGAENEPEEESGEQESEEKGAE